MAVWFDQVLIGHAAVENWYYLEQKFGLQSCYAIYWKKSWTDEVTKAVFVL